MHILESVVIGEYKLTLIFDPVSQLYSVRLSEVLQGKKVDWYYEYEEVARSVYEFLSEVSPATLVTLINI